MISNYQKLFSYLRPAQPRAGFAEEVIAELHGKKRLFAIKQRIAIFGLATGVAGLASIYTIKLFISGVYQTGFIQFFSLAFSDFEVVVASWRSFAITLLESLPVLQLVALFISVLLLLEFIRLLSRDVKFISRLTH